MSNSYLSLNVHALSYKALSHTCFDIVTINYSEIVETLFYSDADVNS